MTNSTKSLKTPFAKVALIAMMLSVILMPQPVSSAWFEGAARNDRKKITEIKTQETIYTCTSSEARAGMEVAGVGQTQTTAMFYAKEAVCALGFTIGAVSLVDGPVEDTISAYDQEECGEFRARFVSQGCTGKTYEIASTDTPSAYRCKAYFPTGVSKQTATGEGSTMMQAKEEAYDNLCALNGNPEGCRMGSWIESCTWGEL